MPRAGAKVVVVLAARDAAAVLPVVPVDWVDEIVVSDDGAPATAALAGRIPQLHLAREGSPQRLALERGADVVVSLRAAGAVDPMLIPRLLEPVLEDRADLVLGARSGVRLAQRLLARALGAPARVALTDLRTGYRACRRGVLEDAGAGGRAGLMTLRALRRGFRVLEVPARGERGR